VGHVVLVDVALLVHRAFHRDGCELRVRRHRNGAADHASEPRGEAGSRPIDAVWCVTERLLGKASGDQQRMMEDLALRFVVD
jgi:hypothetical protein